MAMIALTPYTAFMVGGYTTNDNRKNINYWVYNPERTRFEKPLRFLQHKQNWNYWTRVGRGYKALANCEAERTYAAVGWGGTNQHTEWSVMLRKRWQSNTDTRKPATCHRAIPDLSPARWYLAITALNYRLMVCGGVSNAGTHSDCKWLDTNSRDPLWQDMAVSCGREIGREVPSNILILTFPVHVNHQEALRHAHLWRRSICFRRSKLR